MAMLQSRTLRRVLLMLIDFVLLSFAWVLSYFLRLDEADWAQEAYLAQMRLLLPWVVLAHLGLFGAFGLYQGVLRYVSTRELRAILAASLINAFIWSLINLWVQSRPQFLQLPLYADASSVLRVPFTIPAIYFFVSVILTGGFRYSRRLWEESTRRFEEEAVPTLIVGAGDVAENALRVIQRPETSRYRPVCAVATEPGRVGLSIQGVKVVGQLDDIPRVLDTQRIEKVLIALDEDEPAVLRKVVQLCQDAKVGFDIVPSIGHIASGRVEVSPMRRVEIEDLLGREPVDLQLPKEENYLRGEVVLVTGAGGSIGSELCRQIALCEPKTLLLLGKGENSIHSIDRELKRSYPELDCRPVVADIRDDRRISAVFEAYEPTTVFHAAAHKHVSLMETQASEAVRNNVLGTAVVASAAHRYGAARFILVSTDKAVRPSSVMGATKRLAEMVLFSLARESATVFHAVRFGNVLGSRGSVIPIFEEQIARGGPVTVTHPDVTRFFMTIPEAVSLVLRAGSYTDTASLFLLDMGQPVRILDLATELITLSGLKPGEDIPIQYIGMAPGEKLHEELLTQEEGATATEVGKLWVTHPSGEVSWRDMQELVRELCDLADTADSPGIVARLRTIVPEYAPSEIHEPEGSLPVAGGVLRAEEEPAGDQAASEERLPEETSEGTASEEGGAAPPAETAADPDFPVEVVEEGTEEAEEESEEIKGQTDLFDLEGGGERGPAPEQDEKPTPALADSLESPFDLGAAPDPESEGPDLETPDPRMFPDALLESDSATPAPLEEAGRPEQPGTDETPRGSSGDEAEVVTEIEDEVSAAPPPASFATLAMLGRMEPDERRQLLLRLAGHASRLEKVLLSGCADLKAVPEGLRAKAELLDPRLSDPPEIWNAAVEACPGGSLLFSLPANVHLGAEFFDRMSRLFADSEETVLAYSDYRIVGREERTVVLQDHSGCPHERFEFGPVIVYSAVALQLVGGFNTRLKHAWEYDLHLRLMQEGLFMRIPEPLYSVERARKDSDSPERLYSPGSGALGGFSYLFYPEDVEKEVTEVFESALREVGAWLNGETRAVPELEPAPEVMASVVIPVLNRAEYIGRAIRSVLEGRYEDFEVIVVDNGSTDGTRDVVRELAEEDARVRLIEGSGDSIASALNEGIQASRGKYICQLDSDDEYTPDTLEKMIGHLESHPKCGLAISYYRLMDEEGNLLEDIPPVRHDGFTRNQILRRDGAGAVRVFPKSVLLEFGLYDEKHYANFGEDYDMVLKVSEHYGVDRVPEVLYHYRRHADNTDVTRDEQMKYRNKNRARQQALRRRMALNAPQAGT